MARFLVLTHPREPLSDSAYSRLPRRVEYWASLRERGAEVYSIVGAKGYAVLLEVDSHDELIDILRTSRSAPSRAKSRQRPRLATPTSPTRTARGG